MEIFVINPTLNSTGLHLNVDDVSNALSIDLAFEVSEYFHVNVNAANSIHKRLLKAIQQWEKFARRAGVPKLERQLLKDCFIPK